MIKASKLITTPRKEKKKKRKTVKERKAKREDTGLDMKIKVPAKSQKLGAED